MSLPKPRVMPPARWASDRRNARKVHASRWRWKTMIILSDRGATPRGLCATPSEA
jgi:hypothetical protein